MDVIQQINDLWEPLQRLAPLFNISIKADFLVSPTHERRFDLRRIGFSL